MFLTSLFDVFLENEKKKDISHPNKKLNWSQNAIFRLMCQKTMGQKSENLKNFGKKLKIVGNNIKLVDITEKQKIL